jgi:hypothetical protein
MDKLAIVLSIALLVLAFQISSSAQQGTVEGVPDCSQGTIEHRLDCLTYEVNLLKERLKPRMIPVR